MCKIIILRIHLQSYTHVLHVPQFYMSPMYVARTLPRCRRLESEEDTIFAKLFCCRFFAWCVCGLNHPRTHTGSWRESEDDCVWVCVFFFNKGDVCYGWLPWPRRLAHTFSLLLFFCHFVSSNFSFFCTAYASAIASIPNQRRKKKEMRAWISHKACSSISYAFLRNKTFIQVKIMFQKNGDKIFPFARTPDTCTPTMHSAYANSGPNLLLCSFGCRHSLSFISSLYSLPATVRQ